MGKIDNHPTNSIHHSCPKPLHTQHLHPLYRHSGLPSIGWLPDTFTKSSSHKSLRQSFAAPFFAKSCPIRVYVEWSKYQKKNRRRIAPTAAPLRSSYHEDQTAFANSIAFSKALILSLALAPNQSESRRLSSVRPLL